MTHFQVDIKRVPEVTLHPLYCAWQLYPCIIDQEEAPEELHSAHILDTVVNLRCESNR